jgi:ATP-dependent Clp protease protease subunit
VFLGREVDDAVANRICAQLLLLAAEDPERDIALYDQLPGRLGDRRHGHLRHHCG